MLIQDERDVANGLATLRQQRAGVITRGCRSKCWHCSNCRFARVLHNSPLGLMTTTLSPCEVDMERESYEHERATTLRAWSAMTPPSTTKRIACYWIINPRCAKKHPTTTPPQLGHNINSATKPTKAPRILQRQASGESVKFSLFFLVVYSYAKACLFKLSYLLRIELHVVLPCNLR